MDEMEYMLNEKANGTVSNNGDTLPNFLKRLRKSDEGELAKIEAYVCLTAAVLALIVIMGSMRLLCGHQRFFRLCIWFASTISYGLISYTMGLMTAATFHHELFAIWAVFLLVILGRADSLIAYSLVDNEKRTWYASKVVLQMFWAGWLIGLYVHEPIFQLPLWFLWIISAVRIYEKLKANQYVGKKLRAENGVKLVADFMSYEHILGSTEDEQNHFDPKSMEGYHYLVQGEKLGMIEEGMEDHHGRLKMEKVITTEKIWKCKGRLLMPDQDPEGKLKDVCLSFALYKLLLRRFAGFPLHEAHLEKTRAFVRDGLLQKEEGDDPYRRVRRVIGVELGFLYEFFYTKYPVIFAGGFPVYKIIELLLVFIGSGFAASTLEHYIRAGRNVNLIVFGINVDLFITRAMISVIVIMEIFQFLSNLLCNWNKVKLLVKYVKKSSRQDRAVMEWMIKCLFSIGAPSQFARYINQYSFIKSFDYDPPTKYLNTFLSKFINVRRKGQRLDRIKYPEEATKEIFDFLSLVLSNGAGKLTNGEGSLIRNSTREQDGCLDHEFVLELLKQCAFETHVHGIMVWHIATCLCEYEYGKRETSACETLKKKFTVACCLSNYCAYLAAFVPDLLPDYVEVTRRTFHKTVKQARNVLGRGKTMGVKFEEMMDINFGTETGHDTIVKRGANLGKLLLQNVKDRTVLWKVLADFWVEKSLFLAPSNNANAHAEHLAKGGEFITCLWAVLNHAGIVEPNSPMANTPIEIQCEDTIEIISSSVSSCF